MSRPPPLPDLLIASLLQVHKGWAWFVIIGNGLAGAWALAANHWPGFRSRALWWFTSLAEVAVFVQVCLGVGLVAGQHVKPPQFHMLYGFTAFAAIGIIYAYRAQLKHRIYLLYGLGGLFIMGLGIRAMLVGNT